MALLAGGSRLDLLSIGSFHAPGCHLRVCVRLRKHISYLAVNSSNVSSSCPPLLLRHVVANGALREACCTVETRAEALRLVLTQGLRKEVEVDRAASRNTAVGDIVWLTFGPCRGLQWPSRVDGECIHER